jgi:hypothetical protein
MSSKSDIPHMNYAAWKLEVLKITRYRISLKTEVVQALIERGNELKREGRIRDYDDWSHLMWVLKNKYREMTTDASS